jgi:patatin-related protein
LNGTERVDFTQEIRFAVVMYGGSSLSIYMYGVAQELLRLIRATAADPKDRSRAAKPVSGSERAYRELGKRLARGKPAKIGDVTGEAIQTRFVIDLLSGTSAGGINSVFLAKALANDVELSPLRDLWVETADFAQLLNDPQGLAERHQQQNPPKSLVNSPLMFSMLRDALDKMDQQNKGSQQSASPYAEQLDLFTTFTDVQGRTISLKLADALATERQHLHNFHFVYSTPDAGFEDRNDFEGTNNPFLAFAARSSSAHQAAFEPMTLEDIGKEKGCDPDFADWRKFYGEYLQPDPFDPKKPDDLAREFKTRPLVDGGTLDNSPFTFAIEQLRFRHSRLPVDRKLIYVEPDPNHPEREHDENKKPDAIKNALMALSTIPSYQFIRDDIRRIFERNVLVDRVTLVLEAIERDYARNSLPPTSGSEFRETDLGGMIDKMGTAWGGYHALRVQEITAELTRIIASAAGFKEEAHEFAAIQNLVRAWRIRKYVPHFSTPRRSGEESENAFLYDFDLQRQIRRLKFVIRKAADLSCFDKRSKEMTTVGKVDKVWDYGDPEFQKQARDALSLVIRNLSTVLKTFFWRQRILTSPVAPVDGSPAGGATAKPTHPLAAALGALTTLLFQPVSTSPEGKPVSTWDLLMTQSSSAAAKTADTFVRDNTAVFEDLTTAVRGQFDVITEASKKVKGTGNTTGILQASPAASPAEATLKSTLLYYYQHFDQYDMVAYPILYSTEAGEELDKVEVFRISPEDVQLPINDATKLAGLSLGHFGALVDRKFRLNDILWGRLDCAERLITLLLKSAPPSSDPAQVQALDELRKQLIKEAQEAIVIEEISGFPEDLKAKLGFTKHSPTTSDSEKRTEAAREIEKTVLPERIKEYVSRLLHDEDPLDKFVKGYRVLHEQNTRNLVSLAGRASRVLGGVLDDVADKNHLRGNPQIAWITRLLRIFWGLTEISLPDSFANIVMKHALKLLYLFEVVLIVTGLLLSNDTVQHFGLLLLGITLAINAAMLLIRDLADQEEFWGRVLKVGATGIVILAVVLVVVVIAAIKVDFLWGGLDYIHFKLR